MLSLPIIPTDSLYKFYFVSGFLFVILGFYLMYSSGKTAKYQNLKVDSASYAMDALSKMERSQFKFDSLTLLAGNTTMNLNQVREYQKQTQIDYQKLSEAENGIKNETNKAKYLKDTKYTDLAISVSCMILGFLFMFYGSKRWQLYIQSPQDRLLQIQLQLAEKDLEHKILTGRKHFEPKVLPRPQVRNRI